MTATPTQVRIAGYGGQGVILAGVLLGRAALLEGFYAVQNQSYGAEARGGAARAEVLICTEPIIYPEVLVPDVMVAMSQVALDRYAPGLVAGATLIIDAELVSRVPAGLPCRVLRGPFTQAASQKLGRSIAANLVMLGFLAVATGTVGVRTLRSAVPGGVPKGTEELNLQALDLGARMAGPPAPEA